MFFFDSARPITSLQHHWFLPEGTDHTVRYEMGVIPSGTFWFHGNGSAKRRVPFRAASWKRGFRGLSWFLTRCKLIHAEGEEELRFPVGSSRGVSSRWTKGSGGRAVCVCESNISSSVFESHGRPYFLFSLSKFTSQRKKGRGTEGRLRYRTDSTFPSQGRFRWSVVSFVGGGDLLFFSHCLFVLVFWWPVVSACGESWKLGHIYCLKQAFKGTLPSGHIPKNPHKCWFYLEMFCFCPRNKIKKINLSWHTAELCYWWHRSFCPVD